MTSSALILSLVLWTSPATQGGSPYEVDPITDGTVTVAAFVFAAVMAGLVKPTLPAIRNCDLDPATSLCDPGSLNALDRGVVGMKSTQWRRVSDVTSWIAYAAPIGLGAFDYFELSDNGTFGDLGADLLVTTQAVGMTVLVTDLFKYAVRRPRPTQYTAGAFSGSSEHSMSFPSGHTSSTAAAVFAAATTFALRHPESPWRYGVYAAGTALTGLTAWSRVRGGMHFYSDVLAGTVLGAAMGVVLPRLHRRMEGVALAVAPGVFGEASRVSLSFRY